MTRPYIAIDLETSGLDRKLSEVLELGYCFEDFKGPIAQLPKASLITQWDKLEYAEPVALKMNARLIEAQCNKDVQKFSPGEAFGLLFEATRFAAKAASQWDEAKQWKPSNKVYYAGKNVASFDIPMVTNYFARKNIDEKLMKEWLSYIHYKVIDPGSMFYAHFGGYIPGLDEINKLTGRTAVNHHAIDDALDVVYAVRYSLGIPCGNV